METFILNWLVSIPIFATPLLLASIGVIVTARSGILNMGTEGIMVVGALFSVMAVVSGHSLFWATCIAILAGALISLLFGVATEVFKANQILTSLIIVAMGLGLTGVVGRPYEHKPIEGLEAMDFGAISQIPWLGPIVFAQDILVYVTVVITIVAWFVLYRTRSGLRLRGIGENPATVDAAGINVIKYRFLSIIIGGAICGLAGAYLGLAAGQIWVEEMTAGRGWIAIALAIFARWRPFPAVIGALIFGGTEAIIPRIQALGADVPIYFLMTLPYLLTLVVLIVPSIFFKGWRDDAPASLMKNYIREDRH